MNDTYQKENDGTIVKIVKQPINLQDLKDTIAQKDVIIGEHQQIITDTEAEKSVLQGQLADIVRQFPDCA